MANPRPSTPSGSNAISADKTLSLSREAKLSILTSALEITAIGKEFGIIEPVKVAFSAVNVVLTKIKDTMQNMDDFIDVGVYCAEICSAIEGGTHGKTEENLSPSFVKAIRDLTRTVNDIKATADENSPRTVFSRFFFTDRDKGKIAGWQQDLSRLLQIFNTELNVTTTMTVEETHERVEELRDILVDHVKDMKERRTATCFESSGEHPPPPPPLFFGRDRLVGEILDHVQDRKHVALIGAGGIGKTSIAKAILNHASAQKHFTAGQFFVRCDDFVLSFDRFLGRVAEVVGATTSQSAPLASLCSFFMSCSDALLLVLDNAETILESSIKAEVMDAIDGISSCPKVTLLMTTRTTVLPNNTSWERTEVSPLDLDSSRKAFFWVYKHEQSSSAIDPLLTEIDCHPLSINILASVAAQDSLSINELMRQWDVEKVHLLDPGSDFGKQQSLAASIRFSLNSPTMQQSEDAMQVLQLVAFLPQGVETTTLQQLVPTVRNASRIAGTLGRLSLTHRQGEFITMLAPIRLYILDMHPPGPLLRGGIMTFYYGKLDEYGFNVPGDENYADGSWISSHDDNIERIISHQLSTAPDESTVKACDIFLYCILWHKARKTTLGAVVEALRDDVSIYWQARSLRDIGRIAIKMSDNREAREFLNSARNTFLTGGYQKEATGCLIDLAELSYYGAEYTEARRHCTDVLPECQDFDGEYEKARCQTLLGQIALALGKDSEASEFLTKALESWERQKDMHRVGRVKVELGRLEFKRGNLNEARSHFDAATVIFSDLGDDHHIGWCSFYFGRQEIDVRNFRKAIDLLQKAEKFYLLANSTLEAAGCVREIGRIHYLQKEYSAARTHLTKAKEKFDAFASVKDLKQNAYFLAWVEFREGNSHEAKQILKEAKQWVIEENGYWQAMHARSLGEFAFHEGDKDGAAVLFAQAQEGFEAVGFTSQKMDTEIPEEDSEGWRWFRGGRH